MSDDCAAVARPLGTQQHQRDARHERERRAVPVDVSPYARDWKYAVVRRAHLAGIASRCGVRHFGRWCVRRRSCLLAFGQLAALVRFPTEVCPVEGVWALRHFAGSVNSCDDIPNDSMARSRHIHHPFGRPHARCARRA